MTGSEDVIRAFGVDHVARLTGLSKGQLVYMDRTGFFSPDYAYEDRTSAHSLVYSFRDVVGLRTIAMLRRNHSFSLQKLRKIAAELKQHKDKPWSNMRLYVSRDEVNFREPDGKFARGARSKQYVAEYAIQEIENEVIAESRRFRNRAPESIGRIERHRYLAHNAWVVSGTRIPTQAILHYHEDGFSAEDILREYPSLTVQDIGAALEHEEKLVKQA